MTPPPPLERDEPPTMERVAMLCMRGRLGSRWKTFVSATALRLRSSSTSARSFSTCTQCVWHGGQRACVMRKPSQRWWRGMGTWEGFLGGFLYFHNVPIKREKCAGKVQ
jgi:hypothetical protein